jgi:olfactory receptor
LASSNLRTLMYFFLGNLSVFDILFPSCEYPQDDGSPSGAKSHHILPRLCLPDLLLPHPGGTECFLFSVMAYDHFVTICHSMQYMVLMNHRVCTCLTVGTWLGDCLHGSTFLIFKLPYCGPNEVDSFFCDIPVVLPLACADTSVAQMIGVVALVCFLLILTSYTRIVISILKIHSSEDRCRAFSTCSARLTSVTLVYGPVILVYLRPLPIPA